MGIAIDGTEVARMTKLLKDTVKHDFSVQFDSNPFKITFTFRYNNRTMAGFTLVEQVNCCAILVSTRTFVYEPYQGQGIAQEMMPIKEALAREFGYSMLLATVNVSGNPAEVHILEKFGWQLSGDTFVNPRTKNTIGVFTKVLPELEKEDEDDNNSS
jgi:GNAT superfamily N-acetyltransferase